MEKIKTLYPEYFNNDNIVFKSCRKIWIVVMEKLKTTRTTEERIVYNKKYAKFRGDSFKVLKIISKINPSITINMVKNSIYKEKTIEYVVNEIVKTEFDDDINNICSAGIHYYLSIEPAFSLEFDFYIKNNKITICEFDLTDKLTEYDDDGHILYTYNVKYGILDNKLKCFGEDEKLITEFSYNNGVLEGKSIYYDKFGNMLREYNYKNNVKHGLHKIFHKNKLMFEEKYIDGELKIY
jgi:antitoxin component YwqK of YwqJK toxin-antitoxin module